MSIKGPAIASGLGQTLSCILLATHFIRKKGELRIHRCKMRFSTVREILKRGTPEFMNQLFQPVTVLCYNIIALSVFGEIGVSAFSIVYYIMTVSVSVFIGLSQGIQPLIGRSFGEGNIENEHYYTNKGASINFILALVIDIIMFVLGSQVISLFNPDKELVKIGYDCIKVYGISFLVTAVNIVAITYFTATKRTKDAVIISVLRCLIFIPLFAFALPAIFGRGALWAGITAAELISLASITVMRTVERDKCDDTNSSSYRTRSNSEISRLESVQD